MKIVIMTENCPITGVKYGTIEVPENNIEKNFEQKYQNIKQNNTNLAVNYQRTQHK